jgi:ferric-dicitrate binding protein FerR (iron transport regulator)
MTDSHDIDRIIFLHLSGEADLEEIQELRKWLNSDPVNKEIYENVAEFWKSSKIGLDTKDHDNAYNLLLGRINSFHETNVKHIDLKKSFRANNGWRRLQLVAAVIIFFVISFWGVQISLEDRVKEEPAIHSEAIVEKQNQNGQKSTIKLPDGSTVWLNAGSVISYPKIFDSNERRIILTGEAFFDVQKDVQRPFIVEAGNLNISVLGTQFNVKAFPGENVSNVSLVSGKVKVDRIRDENQYESLFLEPGEEIAYSEENGQVERQKFDVEYVTGWKDGLLILKNDSFDSFIRKLKQWYGVEVEVKGIPNRNFIVTGRFQNENMENVLRTLQFSRDFEFTIEDNLLTLKFKNM